MCTYAHMCLTYYWNMFTLFTYVYIRFTYIDMFCLHVDICVQCVYFFYICLHMFTDVLTLFDICLIYVYICWCSLIDFLGGLLGVLFVLCWWCDFERVRANLAPFLVSVGLLFGIVLSALGVPGWHRDAFWDAWAPKSQTYETISNKRRNG